MAASDQLEDNRFAFLLDKQIRSVNSIIDTKKGGKFVLFIFHGLDCGTCVDAGFHMMNILDKKMGEERSFVYPVMTGGSPSTYQERYGYYKHIYMLILR